MFDQNISNTIDGWYFTKAEILECLQNGHMLNPSIDLSNCCNLNCPYCFVEDKESKRKIRKDGEMSYKEILSVINDLHDCGAKTINIVGSGEPTIDPDFEKIIEYIAERNIKTVLFTNGIRLSDDTNLAKFLLKRNVSIVIKYNSKRAEIQDLLVGRVGYSLKRDRTIDLLIDLGFTAHEPTKLGIDVIVTHGTLREIPSILSWCRINNIFPIVGGFILSGRTDEGKVIGNKSFAHFPIKVQNSIQSILKPISKIEKDKLINYLSQIDKDFGINYPSNMAYFCGGVCTQLLGLYITITGDIYPCIAKKAIDHSKIISGYLGNVKDGKSSISEIWQTNAKIKQIREIYNGSCFFK